MDLLLIILDISVNWPSVMKQNIYLRLYMCTMVFIIVMVL